MPDSCEPRAYAGHSGAPWTVPDKTGDVLSRIFGFTVPLMALMAGSFVAHTLNEEDAPGRELHVLRSCGRGSGDLGRAT